MKNRIFLLSLLSSLLAAASAVAALPPETGVLSLHDDQNAVTIQFGGRSGAQIGIPSWKAVLRRDDAGNLSSLHVPADDPRSLSARTGQWPLVVIGTSNNRGVAGTMSRGRENYALFTVPKFEIVERTPEKIVVTTAGVSKNKHFEHERTYTFTAKGMKIEGLVRALIDLEDVGLWSHWDRRQIADSHIGLVPVRTQGRHGWVYMQSTGQDGAKPLPQHVGAFTSTFPLEIELKLRRPSPIYLLTFLDRNFESADNRTLIHNDRDWPLSGGGKRYDKIISMMSGAVPRGAEQTYELRFEFETRDW